MASAVKICLSILPACEIGKHFTAAATPSGSEPTGIYMPVIKPETVPITVQIAEYALSEVMNIAINITIEVVARSSTAIIPSTLSISAKESNSPPFAVI